MSLRGVACHHVIGRRVDAHGERGRGIGEQVNPQQLRGEQRHNHALAAGLGDAEESGERRPAEHSEHFAHIGAQQVAQELADVVENASSFAHGCDDGAEVVVGENHFRALLGYFSAGNAHGDADIGGFRRRERRSHRRRSWPRYYLAVATIRRSSACVPARLAASTDACAGHLVESRFVG